jgi:hypothetical protein
MIIHVSGFRCVPTVLNGCTFVANLNLDKFGDWIWNLQYAIARTVPGCAHENQLVCNAAFCSAVLAVSCDRRELQLAIVVGFSNVHFRPCDCRRVSC